MSVLDSIINIIYQIICFFYDTFDKCKLITITSEETKDLRITPPTRATRPTETMTSTICPTDTCVYDSSSNEYNIPYSSELNLNSSCDEIKTYILSNLERGSPNAFQSSDDTPITDEDKKNLIFVLDNSSDMITNDDNTSSPGIRFKFCCPTEENCLL